MTIEKTLVQAGAVLFVAALACWGLSFTPGLAFLLTLSTWFLAGAMCTVPLVGLIVVFAGASKRTWNRVAIAVLVIGAVVALVRSGWKPRIRVINASREILEGLELRGRGFRAEIPRMNPGATECVTVEPSGESGLTLTFTASGRILKRDDLAYLEPAGYRLRLVITRDLVAKVEYVGGLHVLPWCAG